MGLFDKIFFDGVESKVTQRHLVHPAKAAKQMAATACDGYLSDDEARVFERWHCLG